MSNNFEKMFSTNHETTGPTKKETIPLELKRSAVEAVATANIIEPLAFQLGAVKMANLILLSEQKGLSRHWMHWLDEEDTIELEETLFDMKNKVHAQHEINPDSKSVRPQDEMYKLFKTYANQGGEILGFIEHHLGHILDSYDIQEILQWINQHRSNMTEQNAKYRELLKSGDRFNAQRALRTMYKTLSDEFK